MKLKLLGDQALEVHASSVATVGDLSDALGASADTRALAVNEAYILSPDTPLRAAGLCNADRVRPASAANTCARLPERDTRVFATPDLRERPQAREIPVPNAPLAPVKMKAPWLPTAYIVSGALALLLTSYISDTLAAAALAIVAVGLTAIAGLWLYAFARARRDTARAWEEFRTGLTAATAELQAAAQGETEVRNALFPPLPELLEAPAVWMRHRSQPEDFLHLRIGTGAVTPQFKITGGNYGYRDDFDPQLDSLRSQFAALPDAPVLVDLRAAGTFGVLAPGPARALAAELALTHSPSETALAVLGNPETEAAWGWLAWLPHVDSAEHLLKTRPLAATAAAGEALLRGLEQLLEDRRENPLPNPPALVVIVDGPEVDWARLLKAAQNGPELGVYFLWLAGDPAGLPPHCRLWLRADALYQPEGDRTTALTVTDLSAEQALQAAYRLAPLQDAAAPLPADDLPTQLAFGQLYNLNEPPLWQVGEGGTRARVAQGTQGSWAPQLTVAALTGATSRDRTTALTGWALALAWEYAPGDLNLLLLDPNGGALADLAALSHCVGRVTDFAPGPAARTRRFLAAEWARRQEYLDRHSLDSLAAAPAGRPATLVIVAADWEALGTDLQTFFTAHIQTAARLGICLLIGAESPLDIPANWPRLELLANPPGRARLYIGSEAHTVQMVNPNLAAANVPALTVGPLAFAAPAAPPAPAPDAPTDLSRAAAAITQNAQAKLERPIFRPWLPELAPNYDLASLKQVRDTRLALGMVDLPDAQTQSPYYFEPEKSGHLLFLGSPGAGRTTALRCLTVAAGHTPNSAPVHVYGIDFSGGLAALRNLYHVSEITLGSDSAAVARMVEFLAGLAQTRVAALTKTGAQNLSEYRETAPELAETPRLLLLVNGLDTLLQSYAGQPWMARFEELVKTGQKAGIHVAASAGASGTLPEWFRRAAGCSLLIGPATAADYSRWGLPVDLAEAAASYRFPAGRALDLNTGNQLQLAILGTDPAAAAQERLLEALSKHTPAGASAPAPVSAPAPEEAPPLASVFEPARASEMPADVGGQPVLGLDFHTRDPLPLPPRGVYCIAGEPGSGRSNAVRWLGESVRAAFPDTGLLHVSATRSRLGGLELWDASVSGAKSLLSGLTKIMGAASHEAPAEHPGLAVFVEDYPDFAQKPEIEAKVLELVRACRDHGHLFFADGSAVAWEASWPLLTEVKSGREGLLLGNTRLRELDVDLPAPASPKPPAGYGFWVEGGHYREVVIPLAGQ